MSTLTDQEVIKMYEEMEKMFGDKLPNFEHHPRAFAHYVKLYRYYKEMEKKSQ